MPKTEVMKLIELNHCENCHYPNRYEAVWKESSHLPHRNTDASGFYTPLSVLSDQAPLPETRARDLNMEDPFIDFTCVDGNEPIIRNKISFHPMYCQDGMAVLAVRNIKEGIRSEDSYTSKICDSRYYLYRHMDLSAKKIFSAYIAECENQENTP